jgi:hypothetical protein
LVNKIYEYARVIKVEREHDTTHDLNNEENESYESAHPELKDIPLPKTSNILYLILNSLNFNIANFYTYIKFKSHISEDDFNLEMLKRSMYIQRDFSALFLHTKDDLVLVYPELIEKAEKLLFKGEPGVDYIKYTSKICKVINDYKIMLHREGYLPDFKRQLLFADI